VIPTVLANKVFSIWGKYYYYPVLCFTQCWSWK